MIKWIVATIALVACMMVVVLFYRGMPLVFSPDTRLDFPLSPPLKAVLYQASLSPSGHNAQMWQVMVGEGESQLFVLMDSQRLLKTVDPANREAYISMGAFVETLMQALDRAGFEASVELLADDVPDRIALMANKNPVVATITITRHPLEIPKEETFALFEKRHSEKRPFLDKTLEAAAIVTLTETIDGLFFFAKPANHSIKASDSPENKNGQTPPSRTITGDKGMVLIEDVLAAELEPSSPTTGQLPEKEQFAYLQKNALSAFAISAYDPKKREELAAWLRFSDEEAAKKADGLPAEQLGISGIIKTLYYLMVNEEVAKQDNFSQQSIEAAKKQLDSAMGFFVLTGNNSPTDWINTGRRMQAFWLKATQLGISLQPMSQLLEESPYKEEIQQKLNLNQPVQMIFRAGYVQDYGTNHKVRRPLKDFVFLIPAAS